MRFYDRTIRIQNHNDTLTSRTVLSVDARVGVRVGQVGDREGDELYER